MLRLAVADHLHQYSVIEPNDNACLESERDNRGNRIRGNINGIQQDNDNCRYSKLCEELQAQHASERERGKCLLKAEQ